MPPCARNPSTSALPLAELGLAPFWKTDSIFGRERGDRAPRLALAQLGGGLPSCSSLLPCPPPQSVQDESCTDSDKGARGTGTGTGGRGSNSSDQYLKQQKIRRLVPGELHSPQDRRKRLGLDPFLPISETRGVGVRATPTASSVEGAPVWSGVGTAALEEMGP